MFSFWHTKNCEKLWIFNNWGQPKNRTTIGNFTTDTCAIITIV